MTRSLKHKPYLFIYIFVIPVYFTAAFFTEGYFHPDEHFQILEFANFKLGKIASYQLPWEYQEEIRSSFLPWIAYLFLKVIYNPYIAVLLLRLLTASLAMFAINRFFRVTYKEVPANLVIIYLLLSYFLWFLPFINVRFSAETWSGLLFLLAVSYVYQERPNEIIVGILCGMAYLCRFQTGIMFAGLFAWLLFIRKWDIKNLSLTTGSFILILLLGTWLDYLFYGIFTCTSYNYFTVNIVNNVAAHFGTMTWYEFVYDTIYSGIFPIGIIIYIGLVIVLFRSPFSLVLWCITPLLLVHLIIPHKELRFIFPLVNFLPLLLISAYQHLLKGQLFKTIAIALSFVNLLAMITAIFSKPESGRIAITRYVYEHYNQQPATIYAMEGDDPFQPYSFLHQSLYFIPELKYKTISSYAMLERDNYTTNDVLIIRNKDKSDPILKFQTNNLHLKEVMAGNYYWVRFLRTLYYGDSINDDEYNLLKMN